VSERRRYRKEPGWSEEVEEKNGWGMGRVSSGELDIAVDGWMDVAVAAVE